jgi:hypothetical protein
MPNKAKCRVCGCTDERACPGGCSWVEPELCSACSGAAKDTIQVLTRILKVARRTEASDESGYAAIETLARGLSRRVKDRAKTDAESEPQFW